MVTTRAVLVANPRGSPPEQPGGDHSGCPPLSILSPTPLASQTRTPTPLSSTTRRLTPSLRLNSPSRAPSETPGANSLNAAASLSTPSGSAGSNKPGPRPRGHQPVNHACGAQPAPLQWPACTDEPCPYPPTTVAAQWWPEAQR